MTTWQDLAGLNPSIANPNLIYPGQQILLPNFQSYTVKPGDTLSGIAVKYDKGQITIPVDPENNLSDAELPADGEISNEEFRNLTAADDDEQDDSSPTEADVTDFMLRHPNEETSADVAGDNADLVIGNNQETAPDPAANPLDAYASYTYGITLFALTKNDYNNMVDDPIGFNPSKALVSSAGRYQDVRDKNFKEDFYFDSFKVTTVVGMSAGSRGTNAITLDFTIIEPYGMTLLDRIMHIAMDEMAAQNYLDIPYLLRIEFFGADDAGNMQKIPSQTKNFPIKLINFKIKASTKGSEYTIQSVPFNHGANLQSIQALKTRMEITATTVKDFFAGSDDPAIQKSVDTVRSSQLQTSGAMGAGGGRGTARDPRILGDTPPEESVQTLSVKTSSFTSAYNAWNIDSVKTKDAKYADTIAFVIDPKIANSKIVDPKNNTVKRVGSVDPNTKAKSEQGQEAKTVDFNSVVHSFEAGTSVNEIINAIIPNSEFFLKQVKDPSKQGKSEVENKTTSDSTSQEQATTLKMWKIVPKLKLGDFDHQRNVWGKNITFFIKTYDVYQQHNKRLPKSPPPKPAKKYDYMYTGKNNSVINFDIDFNALYFTAQQIDRANTESTAGPRANQNDNDTDSTQKNSGKRTIAPSQFQNTGSQMQSGVGGANNRSETQNAQSALQSVYTSAAGDMINLKLQIIGDPHFIKQDDLFISPKESVGSTATDTPSLFVSSAVESLNMDDGEIYCYVTFRTPSDFNDSTGMFDLKSSNPYQVSEFSGYYRVLTVDSEFRGGKFTQTLDLIRMPEQDSPNSSASKTADVDTNRKATAHQLDAPIAEDESSPTEEDVQDFMNRHPGDPDGDGNPNEDPAAKEVQDPTDDEETSSSEDTDLSDIAENGDQLDIAELQSQTTQVEVDWGGQDTILASIPGQSNFG